MRYINLFFYFFTFYLHRHLSQHERMRRGNVFGRVCLSVCLSCSGSNVRKPRPRNFIFVTQIHLGNIQVKFLCQVRRVKVKVTEEKGHTRVTKINVLRLPLKGNLVF